VQGPDGCSPGGAGPPRVANIPLGAARRGGRGHGSRHDGAVWAMRVSTTSSRPRWSAPGEMATAAAGSVPPSAPGRCAARASWSRPGRLPGRGAGGGHGSHLPGARVRHTLPCPGGRHIEGRGHQDPRRVVAWHLDDEDLHRDGWPTDRPSAPPVWVPKRAAPAIAPGSASLPRGGPVALGGWDGQARPPVGRRPCRPGLATTGRYRHASTRRRVSISLRRCPGLGCTQGATTVSTA